MYFPCRGSHLTIWLDGSKHAFVISATEICSWYALAADITGAYVTSGKWIRGYGTCKTPRGIKKWHSSLETVLVLFHYLCFSRQIFVKYLGFYRDEIGLNWWVLFSNAMRYFQNIGIKSPVLICYCSAELSTHENKISQLGRDSGIT